MEALDDKERQRSKAFFNDFYKLYMRDKPPGGEQLFKKYQMVAKQIIGRIKEEGTEGEEQAYIQKTLIKPTGDFIERKEVPEAVRNLKKVVTTLASRYGVPIPADTTVPDARGAQVSSGRAPAAPVMPSIGTTPTKPGETPPVIPPKERR
jgi:hypothetical protein